jgi:hypothetical protein
VFPERVRRSVLPAVLVLLATGVSGCGYIDGGDNPTTAVATPSQAVWADGSLGAGFWDPADPPPPEGTITPSPDSWDSLHPKPGYDVAVVVDAVGRHHRAQVDVLRFAVKAWAASVQATTTEFVARRPADYVDRLSAAVDSHPDLVISVGNGLVDPLAMVSAPNLETQFLLIGAEIAEPTSNVTAVDWTGAGFRGEGLGLPATYDPASFTAERADDAVRAGVAAVLSGLTGIVLDVS